MRRFATAFLDAAEEVGGMERIQYARVRDIIGPNAIPVNQSGTFPGGSTTLAKRTAKTGSHERLISTSRR